VDIVSGYLLFANVTLIGGGVKCAMELKSSAPTGLAKVGGLVQQVASLGQVTSQRRPKWSASHNL